MNAQDARNLSEEIKKSTLQKHIDHFSRKIEAAAKNGDRKIDINLIDFLSLNWYDIQDHFVKNCFTIINNPSNSNIKTIIW